MRHIENRYNGWTNYETWVTALWLDNSQASQYYWQSAAREVREDARARVEGGTSYCTEEETAEYLLSERLKEEVFEGTSVTGEASLYADLLGASLRRVNWWELANHWLSELE